MKKKRLKIAYAPPQTEVCAAEPYKFLTTSIGGDAGIGNDDGEIVGAKMLDISFDNPWDGLEER